MVLSTSANAYGGSSWLLLSPSPATTKLCPVSPPLRRGIPHGSEIAERGAPSVRFLSFGATCSRFAHVVPCVRPRFLLTAEWHSIRSVPPCSSSSRLTDVWLVSALSLSRCRGHPGTCRPVTCFQSADSMLNFLKTRQAVCHGGCTFLPKVLEDEGVWPFDNLQVSVR